MSLLIARDDMEYCFYYVMRSYILGSRKVDGLGEGVAESHPSGHSSRFLLAPPSISRTGCSAEKGDDLSGSIGARARGWGPAPCQTLARERSQYARVNGVGVACMSSKSPLNES